MRGKTDPQSAGIFTRTSRKSDFRYEIALQLRQLYRYVNEQLIATLVQRRPVHLDAACEVIRGLMESFEQVAKEDHSGPVMEHSQQLYAGLTYGKGTLNEVSSERAVPMEEKYEKETWSGDFTANQQPAVTVWNWNIRTRGVCLR